MSGGHLNHQYQRINNLADDIADEMIVFCPGELTEDQQEVIKKEVKQLEADLRSIAKRAKALEWWMSGDWGDKTYYESIKNKEL
jgi:hypothetical protein